ncbi:MAG: capsid cement protein [Candidatus Kapaibacterium sp.]
MPINNLTYNPLLTVTIKAGEALPANRFVDYSGNLCSAAEAALGVSEIAWNDGDTASIIAQGIAIVESADDLYVGDAVCTGTGGTAVSLSGTNPIVGRALDDAGSGDYLRVLLTH